MIETVRNKHKKTHSDFQIAAPVTSFNTLNPSMYFPELYVNNQLAAVRVQSAPLTPSRTIPLELIWRFWIH